MSIQTQGSPVPVSAAQGIEVDKIEKQLAMMWSSASDPNKESVGVTRACTQNLIVYTTPEEDRNALEDLLTRTDEQHPGRTIILFAERDVDTPLLQAYVSMRCRLMGPGRQICGEQITVEAGGPMVESAATAVAPLLIPDLPVYLWWKDIPHYEDKLFDRLAELADRVVIDSAAFDHPYDDLARLAELLPRKRLCVTDLNWSRLTSWRSLLASFWDIHDYRPMLDRIDRIEIRHRPGAVPDENAPQGLLLAGWLAARLGWQIDAQRTGTIAGEVPLKNAATGHSINLKFETIEEEGSLEGRMSAINLASQAQDAEFSVELRNDDTKLSTEARIGSMRTVGRVVRYESRSDAERLSNELSFLTHDAVYEDAVRSAAQIMTALR